MEVRHNTSLLEEAVAHVVRRAAIPTLEAEAEALRKQARAQAHRRLATGGAIALAAVGIGLGIHLTLSRNATLVAAGGAATAPEIVAAKEPKASPPVEVVPASPPGPAPAVAAPPASPAAQPPASIAPGSGRVNVVTTDFSKFNNVTVELLGQRWEIKAGHYFATDSDTNWQNAWCYTKKDVDGVSVSVDLAERSSPSAAPQAPLASPETLTKAGLNVAAAVALATKCPWLDRRTFNVSEFEPPSGHNNPFSKREPLVALSGRTLSYSGDIGSDFADVLKKYDFDKLTIESLGGLVSSSIEAGSWLRQNGKIVEVSSDCLSACVYVLAGGTQRVAAKGARIGVHRFYTDQNMDARQATDFAQQVVVQILKYLDGMGIDQELFHFMEAVPPDDMEYPPLEKLIKWKLITVDASAPPAQASPAPIPSDDFISRDGYDAIGHDLAEMPLRDLKLDGCEERCRENEKCRALTYNKANLVCFLKDDATKLVQLSYAFTAYRREVNTPPPQRRWLQVTA